MEGKLQTTFIPRQPLVENKAKKPAPASAGILSIVGWFIFIVAVAASVGVYLYGNIIQNSITAKNIDLSNKIKSFDTASVDHFVQLDGRLQAASTLLNNHLAISSLLKLIGDNTVQSVQFTDMKYNSDDAGKLTLNLSGKAPNFASVALQSDTFSAQPYFQNQVFSSLGLALDGSVTFKFTASVDSSILQYKVANQ
ncbi:TPA: hypothetical protein DCQ44_01320 [Candidatus Taylorbacteria bacterium]|nr:hypothetical protein [Candidatus Taylorbacteria bacterium]